MSRLATFVDVYVAAHLFILSVIAAERLFRKESTGP